MASSPRNLQGEQQPHTAVDVGALVNSIETKLRQAREDDVFRRESPPTIHRVRPGIREEEPRAYDPQIVSLGPFHHGKGGLEEMEKLKHAFMNDLLGRSPNNSVARYVDAVRDCSRRARAQYSGAGITLQPSDFLEMLVLDGCFLVECLVKRGMGRLESELASTNCNTTLLRNDALLIENQIPFFVVEAVFEASSINWQLSEGHSAPTLTKLAAHFLKIKINPPAAPAPRVHHLLHLYHSSLHPELPPESSPKSYRHVATHYFSKLNLVSPFFYGALYFVLMCRWPGRSHSSPTESKKFPRMIPCATELREAGIGIKKRREPCSSLAVSFYHGTLEIPFISVEESTNSKFRNLVAFEQSCPSVGSYFSSYAIFLDNLINTAADVAVLRSCKVMESKLGSDEEVAHMFNTVCKGAHLNYEKHYLAPVFRDVKRYCETSRHRWRARLVHDYFSSPWAAISVIVASVLLFFTGLQAIYAVLAYVRPPN